MLRSCLLCYYLTFDASIIVGCDSLLLLILTGMYIWPLKTQSNQANLWIWSSLLDHYESLDIFFCRCSFTLFCAYLFHLGFCNASIIRRSHIDIFSFGRRFCPKRHTNEVQCKQIKEKASKLNTSTFSSTSTGAIRLQVVTHKCLVNDFFFSSARKY